MAELSPTEAARRLGVSSSTISAWCREGRIRAREVLEELTQGEGNPPTERTAKEGMRNE